MSNVNWTATQVKPEQIDFDYSLDDYYDLTISSLADGDYYVWQISCYDEPTLLSVDRFGNAGYFDSFGQAYASLVDYLWDNYEGRVAANDIKSIPYPEASLESLLAKGFASVAQEISKGNSTTAGGILRLFF